jgi:uncharacterized protein
MRYFPQIIGVIAALVVGAASAAQLAPGEGVPALIVTAPNGRTNTLIGSIHIPHGNLRQPGASVMDRAKRYVVESIPDAAERPAPKTPFEVFAREVRQINPARAEWAAPLTEAQVDTLRRNVRCIFAEQGAAQVNAEVIVNEMLLSKSPALAVEAATMRCDSGGLLSRGALLTRTAKQKGLPIVGLESQAQIQQRREAVPERIYRYQLYKAFTPDSRAAFDQAAEALNTGAYDEILKALRYLDETPADSELHYNLMVAERNRAWMPTLTRYLDEGGAFVNVGAGHLAGPEGLIALLRGRGYKVEPTLLPAGKPAPQGGKDQRTAG